VKKDERRQRERERETGIKTKKIGKRGRGRVKSAR
jgi:hypothetical protein